MRRTLIENADWIITMNATKDRIRHGDIVYEDNVIREVGTDLRKKYDNNRCSRDDCYARFY